MPAEKPVITEGMSWVRTFLDGTISHFLYDESLVEEVLVGKSEKYRAPIKAIIRYNWVGKLPTIEDVNSLMLRNIGHTYVEQNLIEILEKNFLVTRVSIMEFFAAYRVSEKGSYFLPDKLARALGKNYGKYRERSIGSTLGWEDVFENPDALTYPRHLVSFATIDGEWVSKEIFSARLRSDQIPYILTV